MYIAKYALAVSQISSQHLKKNIMMNTWLLFFLNYFLYCYAYRCIPL